MIKELKEVAESGLNISVSSEQSDDILFGSVGFEFGGGSDFGGTTTPPNFGDTPTDDYGKGKKDTQKQSKGDRTKSSVKPSKSAGTQSSKVQKR